VLVAENSDLKQKLADAERDVRELSAEQAEKRTGACRGKRADRTVATATGRESKANRDFEVMVADLRSQLDEAATQLEKAKLTGANAEETVRLTKENQILRNIVVRERQEKRGATRQRSSCSPNSDKLKIKSDTLNEQIELLAQPITRLSDEELALLRQPVSQSPTTIRPP